MAPATTRSWRLRRLSTPIAVIALLVAGVATLQAGPVAAAEGVVVTGLVTGPTAEPLANVGVYANSGNDGLGGTQTGADGHYTLTISAATFTLHFNDTSGIHVSGCFVDDAGSNFTTDSAGCTSVATSAVVAMPDVALPIALHITGTVTGPDGLPLLGQEVHARAAGADAWTLSGADGTYSLPVEAGDYQLWFYDWSSARATGCYAIGGFTGDQRACAPVLVTTTDVAVPSIQIPAGYSISGTVTGADSAHLAGVNASVWCVDLGFWCSGYGRVAADGTYTIVGLLPGDHKIQFTDPSGTYAPVFYATTGFTADIGAATPVHVPPNATGKDGELPLGYKISGRITGPDGVTGLANINVAANLGNVGVGTGAPTAADGTFSVTVLPGTYTLHYYDPSGMHVSGCYLDSAAGNFTTNQSTCTPVAVPATDVAVSDVAMPMAMHLSGTVTDQAGQPLANIGVGASADGIYAGSSTDASGHYSMAVLPGTYTLHFNDMTGARVDGCYLDGAVGNFNTSWAPCTPVDATTSDVAVAAVAMPLGRHISGTVTGPGGEPLANINVNANANGSGAGMQTDANGHYSMTVLPGTYTIAFHDNSGIYVDGCYAEGSPGSFTPNGGTCSTVTVDPNDATDINVTMPLGRHIAGTVTDRGGQPLSNIGVNVSQGDIGLAGSQTDANGHYSITVLPGDYTLHFNDNSDPQRYVGGCYLAGADGNFTTNWGTCTPVPVTTSDVTVATVVMPLGLHVSGTVNGPDGLPLENIGVNANAEGSGAGSGTDANGHYSITVQPGSYTISFHDPSGVHVDGCYLDGGFSVDQGTCTPVTVGPTDATDISVTMPLGRHIGGTVTGPGGQPLADIGVGANQGDIGVAGSQTDANGQYTITVMPGTYTLYFNDNSEAQRYVGGCYLAGADGDFTTDGNACGTITVGDTDPDPIDVTMPLGFHISGTVTGPDHQPLADVDVGANAETFGTGTRTATDGTFSLTVVAGDYQVQFQDGSGSHVDGCFADGLPGTFTPDWNTCTLVSVTEADRPGINVTMPIGFRISGTVTGPAGPLPDIDVGANTDVFGTGTRTDGDGHYSITVIPGTYTLQVNDSTEAQRYVAGCYLDGAAGNFSADQGTCTPIVVTTADTTGIDVTMPIGLRISGTVFGLDGQPLGAIDVGANTETYGNGTQTDGDGHYALTVPTGSYTLQFGDGSGAFVSGCYADASPGSFTTDWDACTPVVVGTDDRSGLDVRIPTGVPITGTVTGPSGEPLMNIDVNAGSDAFGTGTQTDAYGHYSLTVLPNAAYTVSFTDVSGTQADGCYAEGAAGSFTTDWACTPISVAGSAVNGIDVVMPMATATRDQAIEFPDPGPATMAQSPLTVSPTASSGLPVTLATATPRICTVNEFAITFVAPGDCTLTASQPGDASYDPAIPVTRTFTVTKAPQAITFTGPGPATMADSPLTVSATASSGLAVAFTTSTPSVCTAGGKYGVTITLVGPGDCSISASQAGNAVYDPAIPVTRLFSVTKAPQTITFPDPGPVTLAQSPLAVTATASSRLPVTLASATPRICTVKGLAITLVAPGDCSVTASQAGDAVYDPAVQATRTFSVEKAPQAITFPDPGPATMAQAHVTLSATASSGLAVTVTATTPTVCTAGGKNGLTITFVAPGDCSVTASQAGNAVYDPATPTTRSFTVTKALQAITFGSLKDRNLAQSPFTVSATASSNLTVTFTSATPSVCTADGKNGAKITLVGRGTCTINADQSGDAIYRPAPTVGQTFVVK